MAYSVDGEITLISRKLNGRDSKGVPLYIQEERVIPCKVMSVNQSEFFNAGQNGILSEGKFIVNPVEYNRELRLMHEGIQMKIYRTFRKSADELELYATNSEGLNG